MASPMHPRHNDPERLLDYFEGLLPREEEARLEAHLDECEACRQRARKVLSFSAAWDGWTREGPGPPNLRAAITAAFIEAEEREPHWRARLAHWRARWARLPIAAGRVIVAARDQGTLAIPEGFGDLPFAMQTRGSVRSGGETSAPSAGPEGAGLPGVRVDVSGKDVIVHVAGSRPGRSAQAPLAMLVPTAGKAGPVIQESRGPHEGEFVARFVGVEPGDYVVVVEPPGVTEE
jgi:anti-sigma factor RsiW